MSLTHANIPEKKVFPLFPIPSTYLQNTHKLFCSGYISGCSPLTIFHTLIKVASVHLQSMELKPMGEDKNSLAGIKVFNKHMVRVFLQMKTC